mgnify:CR=1 FL=1
MSASSFRRTVVRVVRWLAAIVVYTAAVGLHHTWFRIPPSATLAEGLANGAFMGAMVIVIVKIHGIILPPNPEADLRAGPEKKP